MKAKIDALLAQCIEDGIARGYERAYKHNDAPTKNQLCSQIENAIWEDLYERFDFNFNEADHG
jgi:hypothetical protein